ncbi:hypothetical protein [Methylocystis echinoides]|uniref:Uncharacterized protein n=1 Tax=Methylocystis echinoides TaxID=29468 RepID=A0A9W6GTS0_9HYPH|nr:hypothetical protein [Methylocystis echinoides]GLI92770.1 hypothetical protein LMG27198_17620 [Methylocystis echinoides]
MIRSNAFSEMLLAHVRKFTDPEQFLLETNSIVLNIGGLICDALELSEEAEDEVFAALRAGIKEIIREYRPDLHALLHQ